jgi:hypothetical protein
MCADSLEWNDEGTVRSGGLDYACLNSRARALSGRLPSSHARHYEIRVPHDAVAHIDRELATAALRMMERNMRAEIVTAADCLDDLR